MKRTFKNALGLLFVQIAVVGLALPLASRQDTEKEYVQVVNVELILRVLRDGVPVAGLKKSDFTLTEDGETREINGFFENRRRIAHAGEAKKQLQQPRLYLVFFWVNNPAVDAEGALAKFFSDIYRDGDRVILSTPAKSFELSSTRDVPGVSRSFLEQWRREAGEKLAKKLRFREDLTRMLEDVVRRLNDIADRNRETPAGMMRGDDPAPREVNQFAAQYSRAVQEYQLREFSPDLTAFETMARSLVPDKNDKFALVFLQHDTLPLYDTDQAKSFCMTKAISENLTNELAAAMTRVEEQAKKAFNARVFTEKIRSLFVQANIQFHLLSLSPDRSERQADANSVFSLSRNVEVYSNWDRIMNEISLISGGLRLDGDRLTAALDQVIAFEDVYYHVTYVPRSGGAAPRKIDIRLDQPGLQVLYGRTLEIAELPSVKIIDLQFSGQLMRLDFADFYPIMKDGVPMGIVDIRVSGRLAAGEAPRPLYSQVSEAGGSLELPFAFPQPGNWELEVELTDQITGRQDTKKLTAAITAAAGPVPAPGRESDAVLTIMLDKAAAYAEKLKQAAFHFICREDVSEDVFTHASITGGAAARTEWQYDYQIICQNGKIAENRVLLEKNRLSQHLPKAPLETVFHSYFSFYMPVTLLAREKRRLYQYRLLGRERIRDQNCWRVGIVRRRPGSIPWGEAWISEDDGAVLKIQLDQTSIVGFDKMAQKAVEKGFMPDIATIHEYELSRDGVRFPSRTTFIEKYKSARVPAFERSRTRFEYRDHMFFAVATKVVEKSK
jgi:hypothetical protein